MVKQTVGLGLRQNIYYMLSLSLSPSQRVAYAIAKVATRYATLPCALEPPFFPAEGVNPSPDDDDEGPSLDVGDPAGDPTVEHMLRGGV